MDNTLQRITEEDYTLKNLDYSIYGLQITDYRLQIKDLKILQPNLQPYPTTHSSGAGSPPTRRSPPSRSSRFPLRCQFPPTLLLHRHSPPAGVDASADADENVDASAIAVAGGDADADAEAGADADADVDVDASERVGWWAVADVLVGGMRADGNDGRSGVAGRLAASATAVASCWRDFAGPPVRIQ